MAASAPARRLQGIAPVLTTSAKNILQVVSVSGPAILEIRRRLAGASALGPLRRVGDLPTPGDHDNLVGDARQALDRLRSLWAITDADHRATMSAWSSLRPKDQLFGANLEPLIKAIRTAMEPSLANEVANSFLPVRLPPGRSVGGTWCTNVLGDVTEVQRALAALGFLTESERNTERPPDMPRTREAIADFKWRIACASLGWKPTRADEDRDGGDRFGGRTYGPYCLGNTEFSVFVPINAPDDRNFVHVFCPAGHVWGDFSNHVLNIGVRAAFDQSKWIVIAVSGVPASECTISTEQIEYLLNEINRTSTSIDGLRMSAHSRGHATLWRSITPEEKPPTPARLDPTKVEQLTVFDASYEDLGLGLKRAGVVAKTFLYDVTVTNATGIRPKVKLHFLHALRAIGFARLIQDWLAMGLLHGHEEKIALANRLLQGAPPLPKRGDFTTRGAPGKVDLEAFCAAHLNDVAPMCDGLAAFVRDMNLIQWAEILPYDWTIEAHQFFVAELIHEAIDH